MSRTNLDLLTNWTRYRPSLCRDCWAGCCRLPVEASAQDLVRLGLLSPDEAQASPKKAARRLIAAGKIKQYRAASGLFTLAQTPGGDCCYLGSDRRCTVYDQRPAVCRSFPEVLGPRPGFCPARKRATS